MNLVTVYDLTDPLRATFFVVAVDPIRELVRDPRWSSSSPTTWRGPRCRDRGCPPSGPKTGVFLQRRRSTGEWVKLRYASDATSWPTMAPRAIMAVPLRMTSGDLDFARAFRPAGAGGRAVRIRGSGADLGRDR